MQTSAEIFFEEMPGKKGNLGLITLNRPSALNALTHQMIHLLDHQLARWEKDSSIKAVLIKAAEGRAFCAGGDVRSVYARKQAGDAQLPQFFIEEYRLNQRIFHYSKPYIALLNGITMGGGAGISIHGSHRVATERLIFAMPETTIGFFPDVGSSYFMSRLSHKIGFYLGMTGERIAYNECFALGLVDQVIAEVSLNTLIQELANSVLSHKSEVTDVIKKFAITVPAAKIFDHQQEIETSFAKTTVEEVIDALETDGSEWCKKTVAIIKTKSPTSVKVTFHELNLAKQCDFDSCLQMESRIMFHFLESHDFFEGVRAVLIDKDQSPRWQPAKLEDVSVQDVLRYFH